MKELTSIFDRIKILYTDEEIEAWEKQKAEEHLLSFYRKQVPERFQNESIDTYKTDTEERKKAKEMTLNFIRQMNFNKFQSLILLGAVGTGKTHLACSVLRETYGQYRHASEIVEEIRRAKSFTAKNTEKEILEFYGKASLLVIDEIGRGIDTVDEQYMIYQIINERYNRRKPTILISNLTKKDFLNYVGIAAADRLAESAKVVEFKGESYRTLKKCRIG